MSESTAFSILRQVGLPENGKIHIMCPFCGTLELNKKKVKYENEAVLLLRICEYCDDNEYYDKTGTIIHE